MVTESSGSSTSFSCLRTGDERYAEALREDAMPLGRMGREQIVEVTPGSRCAGARRQPAPPVDALIARTAAAAPAGGAGSPAGRD